jgi:hypothetical protein
MSFIQQFQIITGNAPLSRRRALVGLSLLALTACSRSSQSTQTTDSKIAYYTCTMHPFVRSQDPKGKCPVCGMNLVAVLKSSASPTAVAAGSSGVAYIAPERLQEIGATTEVVTKRSLAGALHVSSGAALPTGDKFIAFVDHGNGQVEPREVQVGSQTGEYYEVISGLKEGDRVFVSGNFLIDAECRIQGVLKTWGDRP